jgi:NAD+ synthase
MRFATGGCVFSKAVLDMDWLAETARIESSLREIVGTRLRRRGLVVGVSGGIDSSLVVGLAARAFGPERVLALFMPESDSAEESLELGRLVTERFGIPSRTVNLFATLEAMGCYRERDAAIRSVFPEFGPGWKSKIVLPEIGDRARLNVFSLVVQSPDGEQKRTRLPLAPYLTIVAATNMKQRARKLTEYFWAERNNFAVAGTPNRLEYDQGFFVKYGDGAADVKPIAHLYKTQVYAMARAIGVPEEICRRRPTTDTYSLPQGQDEFYFALPYEQMDLCLWAHNHGVPAEEVAPVVGLTPAAVNNAFRDIEAKRRTTLVLHLPPILVEPVPEIRH